MVTELRAQVLLRPTETTQREKHFARKEKVLGQFFTPPEVAEFIAAFAERHAPKGGSACDPACGDGVFLEALVYHGFRRVIGVDTDPAVLRAVPGNTRNKVNILIADALKKFETLEGRPIELGERFDVVVGNPPFSSKYGRITARPVLSAYALGKGRKSQAIEILFLERFIELAKPSGFIGIILPDGPFINTGMSDVRRFILRNVTPLVVVSLPRNIFRGGRVTTSKTSILIARKAPYDAREVLMADLQSINDLYLVDEAFSSRNSNEVALWAESIGVSSLHPVSYHAERGGPELRVPTVPLSQFIIKMSSGATRYGKERVFAKHGIPFTSAKAVTWLGVNFSRDGRFIKLGTTMDIERAKTRVGDILFVRVGVGCSGRGAVVVDQNDIGIADDWIYIIRVKGISPFYVALFMATSLGQRQIEAMKRGTGTVTIPQWRLKGMQMPLVSDLVQQDCEKIYFQMIQRRRLGDCKSAEHLLLQSNHLIEKATLKPIC